MLYYSSSLGLQLIYIYIYLIPALQVQVSDVHVVLYVDCTKLGVLSQHDINLIGTCAEKVLGNNPSRSLDDGYKQNSLMRHTMVPCSKNVFCYDAKVQ